MWKGDKSPPTSAGEDRLVLQWQNALEAMKPENADFDSFVVAVVDCCYGTKDQTCTPDKCSSTKLHSQPITMVFVFQ